MNIFALHFFRDKLNRTLRVFLALPPLVNDIELGWGTAQDNNDVQAYGTHDGAPCFFEHATLPFIHGSKDVFAPDCGFRGTSQDPLTQS